MVKKCVESGRYNNVSEVVREALRTWEKQHLYEEWLTQEAQKGYQDVLVAKTVKAEDEAAFLKLARS